MMASPGLIWSIVCFLLVVGPLIFIHELGHYFVGRWCGVKAEQFSLGFGREIVGWTDRRGTRWKLSALPLGGYVKFAGDMNPASVPSPAWLALPAAERNRTFQAKALWQKTLIVLAGPATNFLFAILVFGVVFATLGVPRTPAVVGLVQPGSAAAAADLRVGDRVSMIAGRSIDSFEDIPGVVMIRPGETVAIDVWRGGRQLHKVATIQAREEADRFGNRTRLGQLGIGATGRQQVIHLPLWKVPGAAMRQTGDVIDSIASVLGQLVTGNRPLGELHGSVGMAQMAGEQATLGWFSFIVFMTMISINLGFINLLPIPLLDGGHLMFYLLEAVRRRPVDAKVQEWAFRGGLALLATFMILVNAHDIASLGVWGNIAGLIARG